MNDSEVAVRFGDDFRRCLIAGDVREMMRLWNAVAPAGERIHSESAARATMHMARTQSAAIPVKLRQYSQRWLDERGLGAFVPRPIKSVFTLPDSMKRIRCQ